ncbi:hypothetical protein ACPZ19_40375 [Amycolatopsis lurida]
MKRIRRTSMIAAACLVLVACGGPDPAVDRESPEVTGGVETTDEQVPDPPGGRTEPEVTDEPPDIPGGPIDYDNTRTGGGRSPKEVKADMEGQLSDKCGPKLCGVKVVIAGSGKCTESVTPRPVRAGGRITVLARACLDGEVPSEEPSEEPGKSGEPGKPAKSKPVEPPEPSSESGTG